MRFDKNEPNIMQYKYGLQDTKFKRLDISKKRKTAGRKKDWTSVGVLCCKYPKQQLPISENKKKDLKTVLALKIIPPDYKSFYNELPTAKTLNPIESEDK